MKERIEKFQSLLPDELDGAIILSPQNRRYLTGFPSSAGVLFLTREQAWFLIDSRYREAAASAVKDCEVVLLENLSVQFRQLVKEAKVQKLGVEGDTMSLVEYQRYQTLLGEVKLQDGESVSGILKKMRAQKDKQELFKIREAQRLTDEAFTYILDRIRPGVSEKELALELEFYMRKQGADGPSFDFIVVSGKNSSMPHGVPTGKELERGDFVTMDFGGIVDGYCSDMTRTVAIGSADEEHRRLYNTVLSAQKAAMQVMKPGVPCQTVDAAARDLIAETGYAGCFGHGLGHSLGLEIHEQPACSPSSKDVLEPGMLMTVEPGIYLEGRFGCRIEDMVEVTQTGIEDLTHSPKELLIL